MIRRLRHWMTADRETQMYERMADDMDVNALLRSQISEKLASKLFGTISTVRIPSALGTSRLRARRCALRQVPSSGQPPARAFPFPLPRHWSGERIPLQGPTAPFPAFPDDPWMPCPFRLSAPLARFSTGVPIPCRYSGAGRCRVSCRRGAYRNWAEMCAGG